MPENEMSESQDNPKRTLSHLRRLTRDGQTLLHDRPLDEWAHAKWLYRAERYLERKMPEVQVLPPDQLISIKMHTIECRCRFTRSVIFTLDEKERPCACVADVTH